MNSIQILIGKCCTGNSLISYELGWCELSAYFCTQTLLDKADTQNASFSNNLLSESIDESQWTEELLYILFLKNSFFQTVYEKIILHKTFPTDYGASLESQFYVTKLLKTFHKVNKTF